MDKEKLVKATALLEDIEKIKRDRSSLEWYICENFLDSFKDRDRKNCFKRDIDFEVMIEDLRQTLRKYYDHEGLEKLEKEFSEL